MTTYGPFGFVTATTDGSNDFLYTNTQPGPPSQDGDTLPATTGNLQLWWNDDATGSTDVGPTSGQEGSPEGYLHIEASDTGTGWDDTYDIEFDTTLDCSTEQFQFNFYTNQRGDDNDVTCQIQINKNGAGWIDVGAEFGGSGDPNKVATGGTQIWASRSVDLSDGGTHTDASTRVRILLTMPSDTGGLSWHNDYGIDTIEIVGSPLLSNEVKGATFSHNSTSALGGASVSLWLDNGNDTITFKSQITSDSTDGSFVFTGISSATTSHFIAATLVSGSSDLMDISERTITPSSTYGGSVDLYLRSQVDKSETAGDGDLRLRGQSEKGPSGISGNGDLQAQDSTLSAEGTSQSAGNGALTSAASTLAGSGLSQSLGNGALQSAGSTLAGSGELIEPALGNGALVSTDSTLAGSGTSASLGSGALVSTDATVAGEGTSQSAGNGNLQSAASTLAGEGVSQSSGNGTLVSSDSQISGSGVVVAGSRTGNGDLSADACVISGEGFSQSLGNGALVAANSNVAGSAIVLAPGATNGNGNLASADSSVSGEGVLRSLGSGNLASDVSVVSGLGTSFSVGNGNLVAADSRISGSADTGVTVSAGQARFVYRKGRLRASKRIA